MTFLQAKHYREGRRAAIRLIVVHDMEAPEGASTAEGTARYFAIGNVVSSAHVCVDNNSEVYCVRDGDTAFAAPPCNDDGLHIEHAGYARQTHAEWMDAYSTAALRRSAKIAARWCVKYKIPPVTLTHTQLKAGKKGIVGHRDISAVYRQSTHTDPGPHFPWAWWMNLVRLEHAALTAKPSAKTKILVVKSTVWAALAAAGLALSGTAVAAVLTYNNITDPTQVKPGTTISVPVTVTATPKPTTPTKSSSPTVTKTPAKPSQAPAYPRGVVFKPGVRNAATTRLGQQLIKRGYGRYYQTGPGPVFTRSDARAVRAFEQAHIAILKRANGYPGPMTWRLLFSRNRGK